MYKMMNEIKVISRFQMMRKLSEITPEKYFFDK